MKFIKYILCFSIYFFMVSCTSESYNTTQKTCVKGHYRVYETGGVSTAKSTMTANRLDSIFVCDSFRVDTVTRVRFIFK